MIKNLVVLLIHIGYWLIFAFVFAAKYSFSGFVSILSNGAGWAILITTSIIFLLSFIPGHMRNHVRGGNWRTLGERTFKPHIVLSSFLIIVTLSFSVYEMVSRKLRNDITVDDCKDENQHFMMSLPDSSRRYVLLAAEQLDHRVSEHFGGADYCLEKGFTRETDTIIGGKQFKSELVFGYTINGYQYGYACYCNDTECIDLTDYFKNEDILNILDRELANTYDTVRSHMFQ